MNIKKYFFLKNYKNYFQNLYLTIFFRLGLTVKKSIIIDNDKLIFKTKSKKEFVDSDTTRRNTFQICDKSGGPTLGPLAICYTDANKGKVEFLQINKTTDNYTSQPTRD